MKKRFFSYFTGAIIMILAFTFHSATAQNYSLYGVTESGGSSNKGTIFRYEYPSGKDTVIFSFNGTNGSSPLGYLMLASNRYIYSQTKEGGTSNDGVFYCFNPITYKDTVLINFHGSNGSIPLGGVMQASNGLIYGLTSKGGTYHQGLCYSYDPVAKVQQILFSFDGTNGSKPADHMLQATNGLLYGHTEFGGTYGYGVIFSYNIITGKDSVVYNFNGTDGNRSHGFMQASNGLIYGITMYGGTYNDGVLYSYDPVSGLYTDLINYDGTNGKCPNGDAGALMETSSGLLYGATELGGTYNSGVLYTYNLNTGQDSILFNFGTIGAYGKNPWGNGYVQIPGGMMFLPVDSGGAYGLGTLLSYNPITGNLNKLLDFNDTNGANPEGNLLYFENESEGVNNIENNGISNLFPNPNNGIFTIQSSSVSGQWSVEIYNEIGEKVFSQLSILHSPFSVDLSNQPEGIYFYRLLSSDGNHVSCGKFIIESHE